MAVVSSFAIARSVIRQLAGVPTSADSIEDNNRSLQTSETPKESGSNKAIPHGDHPLDAVLDLAKASLQEFDKNVIDYVATMSKRERINGVLGEPSTMTVKIINRKMEKDQLISPMHVYLRFNSPKSVEGREVIWVEGKNDGYMIAHEAGYLNLVRANLAPNGPLAMMATNTRSPRLESETCFRN